jgi:hypothetical protein
LPICNFSRLTIPSWCTRILWYITEGRLVIIECCYNSRGKSPQLLHPPWEKQ